MSTNQSNKNYSFINVIRILFLLILSFSAVISCGDDSTSPASTGGSTPIDPIIDENDLIIENLVLEAVSANSVTVAWDPLYYSNGSQDTGMTYQVAVSAVNNNNVSFTNTVAVSASTMQYRNQISGLTSGDLYRITLKAVSGGKTKTKSEGELHVVPSGTSFSAAATVNKLATITDITNVIDTEITVTWDQVDQAIAYAVISANDKADLARGIGEILKDKKTKIVCTLELPDTDCPIVKTNAAGKLTTTLTGMIRDSEYTTMVLPFSFRDLVGLKVIDEKGNKIGFVQAVDNLIGESSSAAGQQVRQVGVEIVNNTANVTAKAKVFFLSSRKVVPPLAPPELVASFTVKFLKSSSPGELELFWEPPATGDLADTYILRYNPTETADYRFWKELTTEASEDGLKLAAAIDYNTTNVTVTGLTEGYYFFRIYGSNAAGLGQIQSKPVSYFFVKTITFTPDSITNSISLGIGESIKVTAALSPPNAIDTDVLWPNLTWTSSDPNVATVSDNGDGSAVVAGVSIGSATLWAITGKISNSIPIEVKLASPSNFRQTSAKSTAIDLAWDISSGTRITYKLSQIKDDGTTNSLANPTGSPHTVSGLTPNTYYRYQLVACAGTVCSFPLSLLAVTAPGTYPAGNDLNAVITAGKIPTSFSGYDQMAQDIFSSYTAGKTVIPRYVVAGGSGDKSGTAWSNAADSLKTVLDGITDASVDKVYAVLLGPGVYDAGASMAMKKYVTIAGGISPLNTVPDNAAAIGPTMLSGNKSHGVFHHDGNGLNSTARLYGVTIAYGKATDDRSSGGMYNDSSSPILTRVVFMSNTSSLGGGMYNRYSSPILKGVVFSGNTAGSRGGGMFNYETSPILKGVVFSGNTAGSGGGMANEYSYVILTGVVFSGNTANDGSGIYKNSSGSTTAVNTIFWGQSIKGDINFYYSVVQGGTSDSTNNIVTTDPKLGPLTYNGGGIDTMAIPSDSSAKDKGLYVRMKGSTLYYSIDNSTWYATPKLNKAGDAAVTLPADTIDLTATDMRGYPVQDRPDIGVYEVQPSP